MKEKDLGYIVKLEKAIKKKYGEDAIQNPAKFWDDKKEKKYLQQLKDLIVKQERHEGLNEPENVNGILITRKLLNKESIFSCPVCNMRARTINDDIYNTKFGCCEKCYIQYIDGREERWLKGWRPDNVERNT